MRILITGAAGFVGSKIVEYLRSADESVELYGIDNLSRKGSETNIKNLTHYNCTFIRGDIGNRNDVEALPPVDWIIDCAANPSVLAGLDGSTLDLINNNLTSTFYLLEKCKREQAGFIMLSTSRVYSINELNSMPFECNDSSFQIPILNEYPNGFSLKGVNENFSTAAPISLYGATKLSSEIMALEYHHSFGFPVWINRCGVIAGPGQFGKIDQGIFSYWTYQYLLNNPLSFIGFEGAGFQARDMIHPYDVFSMVHNQIFKPVADSPKILNLGGGINNTMSLFQLDQFCKKNIDENKVINKIIKGRNFDIPFYATDTTIAEKYWDWKITISSDEIIDQILFYAQNNLEHIRSIS